MVELVGLFGPKRWSAISQRFPGRIGKQCRERWVKRVGLIERSAHIARLADILIRRC